jgi:ACS family tartrate transporter-like MFS transporter
MAPQTLDVLSRKSPCARAIARIPPHEPIQEEESLEQSAMRKIYVRLLPFLVLSYILTYLDRINVSFAALTMRGDLRMSASAFGFATGAFFCGYFLFEVPSNVIMARVGARLWIARIMIT